MSTAALSEEQVQELRVEVGRLRAEIEQLRRERAPEAGPPAASMSRRGLLRAAGAAAAGVAAGMVATPRASPVLAANGGNVILGQDNAATAVTSISGSVLADAGLRVSNYYTGPFDDYSDALQAYTYGAGLSAVYGRNDAPGGAGVYGYSGNGVGGSFSGGMAPIRLQPAGTAGAPTSNNHQQGELYVDSAGALWMCTQSGTPSLPGTFKQAATTDSVCSAAAYTPPNLSQFSWLNQDQATAVQRTNGVFMQTPTNNGHLWRALVKSAPSTPFDVRVAFIAAWQRANYDFVCIVLRESASGKLVTFGVDNYNAYLNLVHSTWNSPTSWNAHYAQFQFNFSTPVWLRLKDDGTTRTCSVSPDGADWVDFMTSGHTDFITADQVGFGIDANSNTTPVGVWWASYKEQ